MKVCVKCQKEKTSDNFHKDIRRKDGLFPYCRDCRGSKKRTPATPRLTPSSSPYYRVGHKYLHRMVMEEHIGRPLLPGEVVHHINGNKTDNRLENLKVVDDKKHKSHHYHEHKHLMVPKVFDCVCHICGTEFQAKAPHARYCSRHCVYVGNNPRVQEWKRLNK